MGTSRWIATTGQLAGILLALATPVSAQIAPCRDADISSNLPPPGSAPLVRCIGQQFHPEGTNSVDGETYNYYIRPLEPSMRSQNKWIPYNQEQTLAAFSRLMRTNFLDDCWVEVIDEPYENGVMGKHVVFHLEERLPVKAIDFTGSNEIATSQIEETLRKNGIFRPDGGFVEEYYAFVRKVRGVIQNLYAENGFPFATVEVKKALVPGDRRLLRVTFDIRAGLNFR